MRSAPAALATLGSLCRCGTVTASFHCGAESRQGSPISPLLANYFLLPFDQELEKTGNRLIRYGDDFVILCQNREQADAARDSVRELRSLRAVCKLSKKN